MTMPITGGPRFHETRSDSGHPMRRGFRGDCGSSLLVVAHPRAPRGEGLAAFDGMPPIPESLGR